MLLIVSVSLFFISYYFYLPYLIAITKKHDPLFFRRTGFEPEYIYRMIDSINIIHSLIYTFPHSISPEVRFHAKILRFTIAYTMLFMILVSFIMIVLSVLDIEIEPYTNYMLNKINELN